MADAKRARIFEHPGRIAVIAVALIIVVNLAVVLGHNADTRPAGRPSLPSAIEAIQPERGQLTGLIDTVSVDLADNLQGDMVVDGLQLPDDQLEKIPQLGVISFRPGPGKELPRLQAGDNTVVVHYWQRGEPRPANPPSFSWRFRAAA
jgi:hypothetical protein